MRSSLSRRRRQQARSLDSQCLGFPNKSFDLIGGIDEIEGAILALGYCLRIISSDAFDDLAATIPVWIRRAR